MEVQRLVPRAGDLEALLVHGAVVSAAEEGQVGQRGGASAGPVLNVMPFREAAAAAWEAAALVAGL